MLPSIATPSSSLPILALATWGWIVCVLAVAWSSIGLGLCLRFVMVWRAARRANAPLTFGEIIAMRRRKVDPGLIIQAYHEAKEHRLKLTINQIERHHAHGGRVLHVIDALQLAESNKIRASWTDLCRRDLNSEDLVASIRKRIEEATYAKRKRSSRRNRPRSRRTGG